MSSKSEKSNKSWKFDSPVGRVRIGRKSTIEVGKREEKQQYSFTGINYADGRFRH